MRSFVFNCWLANFNMHFPQIKFQWRFMIAFMIFTCMCINYMMRVNISVNLVAMVPVGNHTYSNSQTTLDWSPYERAQVLSGFFWGYMCGNLLGGSMAELLGARIATSIAVSACIILTFLSPAAAKYSYVALLVVRILMGIACGTVFPTLHIFISKWAIPSEKGRFLGALIGGTIGTFIAWFLCGLVIEPFGWEWGFYLFGIIGVLWLIIYWNVVYDSPETHPRISNEELQYIKDGMSDLNTQKRIPPYLKIMTSIPFWSLCLINFGNGWGIYFVITAIPNFLASVLNYGTSSTGLLSALIYVMRSTSAFLFGYAGDLALKRGVTLKVLRKVATLMSHILPGCLVICVTIPGHGPEFYVSLMIVAMGLNGSVTLSNIANAHDLTNNFVGSVAGISTVFTTAAGVISPFVTAYFTKDDETNHELWKPVFYVGGFIYIMSGLQFLVFGSTEKQPWDTVDDSDQNQTKISLS